MPNDSADSKLIIIAKRIGQLGNRLTLFANFIAFAEEYGYHVVNAAFYDDAKFFDATLRDVLSRYPVTEQSNTISVMSKVASTIRKSQIIYQTTKSIARLHEKFPIFGEHIVTLRDIGNDVTLLSGPEVKAIIQNAKIVFVHGWNFRAPNLVKLHAEKIRYIFRPAEKYLQPSQQVITDLKKNADVIVGIHIRHRDYAAFRGGKFFFSTSRYATWMHEVVEQFQKQKVSFLICSDEPRNTNEFHNLSVGFGPGSAMSDLYALAECDYILGPMSTFSQWASFYGAKPVLLLQSENDRAKLENFRISWLDGMP